MSVKSNVIFEVLADTKNFENNLNKANKQANKMSKALKIAMTATTGAFIFATNQAMKFEKSIANISTVIDTTVESTDKMKNSILEMSKDTNVPIIELTDSLYNIRSAGIKAENQFKVLEVSSKLAAAGLGTQNDAVNILTTSINLYADENKSADEIANILFTTVKNGKNTIAELSQSFGSTAPIIKSIGLDLENFSAATSALTAVGIPASVAQTQLRASITSLKKPSKEMIQIFEKLGVETGQELIETSTDLADVFLKVFNEAEDMGVSIEKVVGSTEGATAITTIATTQYKSFADTLKEMKSNTENLDIAYKKQTETVSFLSGILKNDLNRLFIQLGNILLPSVEKGFKQLSTLMRDITPIVLSIGHILVGVWGLFSPILIEVFSILSSMVGVFGGLITAIEPFFPLEGFLKGIVIATIAWKTAQMALNFAMKMNPIGLIITGIVLLSSLIVDMIVDFEKWKSRFLNVIDTMTIGWKKFWNFFKVMSKERKKEANDEIKEIELRIAKRKEEEKSRQQILKNQKVEKETQVSGNNGEELLNKRIASKEKELSTIQGMEIESNRKIQEERSKSSTSFDTAELDKKINRIIEGNQKIQEVEIAVEENKLERVKNNIQLEEEEEIAKRDRKVERELEYQEQDNERDVEIKEQKIEKEQENLDKMNELEDTDTLERDKKRIDSKKKLSKLEQFEQNEKVKAFTDNANTLTKMTDSKNKQLAGIGKAASLAQIAIETPRAAVSAMAALSGIPLVGPSLGMLAAGAAIAYGAEQASRISSFSFAVGTDFVKNDMSANIHKGEAIIPARQNQFLQSGKLKLVGAGDGDNSIKNVQENQTIINFDGAIFNGDFNDEMIEDLGNKLGEAIENSRIAPLQA